MLNTKHQLYTNPHPQDSGWNDSTDVLQGMDRSHLDLKPSSLPFDSSQPLLDLHLGSDLSLNTSSFLNQWSNPRDLYYSNYPSRLTADQDAWNPLLLTGVPASSSLSHMNMSAPLPEQEYCLSHHHYSDPSESGSQYMGSYSADSGYGSTSCAAQSVVASTYGVDSSSPQMGVKENAAGSAPSFAHSRYASGSGSSFTSELAGSPSQMFDGVFKCDHPSCEWSGKCPSDKRYVFCSFWSMFVQQTDARVVGNTRLAIASCSNATNRIVLARKASGLSMTLPVIRNACITRSLSVGPR